MLYNERLEAIFQKIQSVPQIDAAFRRARDSQAELESSLADASRATGIRTSALQGTDLRDIPFPEIPFYDGKHGFMVSQLADTIGNTLNLSESDRAVARMAGLLHDLGREKEFTGADPQHNTRSAEAAHKHLTGRKDGHGDRDFIARVCRYIALHSLDGTPTSDPIAMALHDADALEASRFKPGTTAGMLMVRKRKKQMLTDFGRNPDTMKGMMIYHGWGKA